MPFFNQWLELEGEIGLNCRLLPGRWAWETIDYHIFIKQIFMSDKISAQLSHYSDVLK